jgi:hypothetical protein
MIRAAEMMNLTFSFDKSEDDPSQKIGKKTNNDSYRIKILIKRRTMIIKLYRTNKTEYKAASNN